ncbi:MAG: hypothetical protein IKS49_00970 [Actinomycetaceae bacterium]|nr:hypothetical protein [Actinomycetaceae bacterium]
MSSSSSSLFAQELKKCLSGAQLTPADAVEALNDAGFPVTDKTFSYWLQGYFLPRSEAAFPMIVLLESICNASGNTLSNALFYDLSSGKAFVPGESLSSDVVNLQVPRRPSKVAGYLDNYFDHVEETTDWDADMIRKVIKDEVRISADYKTAIHKTTNIALIPQAPNPSMQVSWIYEEGDKPLDGEYVMDVQGARITYQEVDEDKGIVTFSMNLSLDDVDTVPGQLHTISYTWGNTYEKPRNRICGRIFPWELDFYSCTVIFEGEPPKDVGYVVLSPYEDEAGEPLSVTPLEVTNGIAKMSAENFGEVSGYIRYIR